MMYIEMAYKWLFDLKKYGKKSKKSVRNEQEKPISSVDKSFSDAIIIPRKRVDETSRM